ncbi:MAG: aminoglycoside 3'-phosphotransferase [Clostridia bacterium]|nr:aminoglycoside 3'-phosphotransferase [Clostridia bacterium]
MMHLPAQIAAYLPEAAGRAEDIGKSGATVLEYPGCFLKVQEDCNVSANEYNMLLWMQGRLPVPQIIAAAHEDGRRYLLTRRMPGAYLCTDALLDDQVRLAELCAGALRTLWAVDIATCPTRRTLDEKFREIEEGLRGGWITAEQAGDPTIYDVSKGGFASPAALFDWLARHRPEEDLVLTHGDLCLPNIFADEHGLTGFIDVGLAGVADRWVDIEKCLWSMWANTTGFFGGRVRPFDRQLLFDALGMQPDEEKLRYYGLLDALC